MITSRPSGPWPWGAVSRLALSEIRWTTSAWFYTGNTISYNIILFWFISIITYYSWAGRQSSRLNLQLSWGQSGISHSQFEENGLELAELRPWWRWMTVDPCGYDYFEIISSVIELQMLEFNGAICPRQRQLLQFTLTTIPLKFKEFLLEWRGHCFVLGSFAIENVALQKPPKRKESKMIIYRSRYW